MFRARWLWALSIGLVAGPALVAGTALARPMSVDIWTDRGKDAIYEPDDPIEIKVRASDDAYLLVYDIDSEGAVRVLYPYAGSTGYIAGGHTYRVPPQGSGLQLVVQGPTGQGYVVAVVSREPFNALPRYLRPYDPQAEHAGYVGEDEYGNGDDEDSYVDADGHISGDPFVAMERIRRQVLYENEDTEAFGTAYTAYYIHEAVRYPRYLCNDCHRSGHWAWWDGWDPYYASCSAFDFRVYWGWSWGPRYWFGTVPYYCYVPRCYPCAPYDRPYYTSWGGYGQWHDLWGGPLVRYKSPPPAGYAPPADAKWAQWKGEKPLPPGFMRSEKVRGVDGREVRLPVGANRPQPARDRITPVGQAPGASRERGIGAAQRQDRPRQVRIEPRGGAPGSSGTRERSYGGVQRQDRPRQVQVAPRGNYRDRGTGRYTQPGRVSAPRATPGGGNYTPRRESAPSRAPAVAPAPRNERSGSDSRPAPSQDSGSRSSPSSNRGERGDAGGGRGRR
jgi:hypothetical protein